MAKGQMKSNKEAKKPKKEKPKGAGYGGYDLPTTVGTGREVRRAGEIPVL